MVQRGPNEQYETPEEWQRKVQLFLPSCRTRLPNINVGVGEPFLRMYPSNAFRNDFYLDFTDALRVRLFPLHSDSSAFQNPDTVLSQPLLPKTLESPLQGQQGYSLH